MKAVKSYKRGVNESLGADRTGEPVHCSRSFQSRVRIVSIIYDCTSCYASLRNDTDQHAIDQKYMCLRKLCMQLKVKIIIFHPQSIDL